MYGPEFGTPPDGPAFPPESPGEEDEQKCIDYWVSKGMNETTLDYLVAFRQDLEWCLPRMRARLKRSVRYTGLG